VSRLENARLVRPPRVNVAYEKDLLMYSVVLLSLLAGLAISCGPARATPEENFWRWFQNHQDMLYDFERNQAQVFGELSTELHRVNSDLTFEFGPIENGRRELVISADGIRAAFPAVQALYAAAPSLPRWKLTKFRPRRKPMDVNDQGISVSAASVTVQNGPQWSIGRRYHFYAELFGSTPRGVQRNRVLASRQRPW
jgi:hypothetical protein